MALTRCYLRDKKLDIKHNVQRFLINDLRDHLTKWKHVLSRGARLTQFVCYYNVIWMVSRDTFTFRVGRGEWRRGRCVHTKWYAYCKIKWVIVVKPEQRNKPKWDQADDCHVIVFAAAAERAEVVSIQQTVLWLCVDCMSSLNRFKCCLTLSSHIVNFDTLRSFRQFQFLRQFFPTIINISFTHSHKLANGNWKAARRIEPTDISVY